MLIRRESAFRMSDTIQIERFARQKQTISGQCRPSELAPLADYLAAEEGEIRFSFRGSELTDAAGGQKRCIRCIILGWFLVSDPLNLKPARHDLDIDSRLVVVRDESALPPLQFESDDEDYIVCAGEMNVLERVAEEILLSLPTAFMRGDVPGVKSVRSSSDAATRTATTTGTANGAVVKISPFARLVELKKK